MTWMVYVYYSGREIGVENDSFEECREALLLGCSLAKVDCGGKEVLVFLNTLHVGFCADRGICSLILISDNICYFFFLVK